MPHSRVWTGNSPSQRAILNDTNIYLRGTVLPKAVTPTLTSRFIPHRQKLVWIGWGIALTAGLVLVFVISGANLLRSRSALRESGLSGHMKTEAVPFAPTLEPAGRKVVRTAAVELEVADTRTALESVRQLAAKEGGYIEDASVNEDSSGRTSAFATMRTPAATLESTLDQLRHLANRVVVEKVAAHDVTRQYVDSEATLRNYRAEEAQYLQIMRRATSVSDTVQVAQRLADVRERIDKLQAEFSLLNKQIDLATISVTLYTKAASSTAFHWRPWTAVRSSFFSGLQSVADYADLMVAFFFLLPAVLLWAVTVLIGARVAWVFVRWFWKKLSRRTQEASGGKPQEAAR
jgi:hypothetical protein